MKFKIKTAGYRYSDLPTIEKLCALGFTFEETPEPHMTEEEQKKIFEDLKDICVSGSVLPGQIVNSPKVKNFLISGKPIIEVSTFEQIMELVEDFEDIIIRKKHDDDNNEFYQILIYDSYIE